MIGFGCAPTQRNATQRATPRQISLGVYAGWYSVRDEAFYGESELVDGKAPSGAVNTKHDNII